MSPTYKNKTTLKRWFMKEGAVEPNGLVESPIFCSDDELEFMKISDFPMFNPVLFSEKIIENSEIKVPLVSGKYTLHFYVESGNVTIWFNSKENKPPLRLYEGAKWNVRCLERIVDKVIVESNKEFSLYLIVERI